MNSRNRREPRVKSALGFGAKLRQESIRNLSVKEPLDPKELLNLSGDVRQTPPSEELIHLFDAHFKPKCEEGFTEDARREGLGIDQDSVTIEDHELRGHRNFT